jgi:hypothetical protein
MSKRQRRRYSPEEKAKILRLHLLGIRQSNPSSGRGVFLMQCRHDGNRRDWRSEAAKPRRDQTTGEGIRNQWTVSERIL